jgi:hydrogenase maturation factor
MKDKRDLKTAVFRKKIPCAVRSPLVFPPLFGGVSIAFTIDSFVAHPLCSPGGSNNELAVNGTVNNLAVSGRGPAQWL